MKLFSGMKLLQHDRWIPFSFIGFFVLLFALEANFIAIAYRSFTGLVTDEPYATGLHYNEIIAAREAEQRLGWQIGTMATPGAALESRLEVTLRDRDGRPLAAGLKITAERMTRFPQVIPVEMTEVAPGQWQGLARLPLAGRWSLRLIVTAGADKVHRIAEIEVEP